VSFVFLLLVYSCSALQGFDCTLANSGITVGNSTRQSSLLTRSGTIKIWKRRVTCVRKTSS
jgi:hypothetical protein